MKHFLLIFAILIMLVVAGCLREVETKGGGTKTEPLSPEEKSEPPPEPPTNTPVQPKTEPKVDTAPKTEPKAEAKKPLTKEESARHAKVIEAAIRKELKKPEGELTKADLAMVAYLYLQYNQLTNVKGLEKLTQLRVLDLGNNPDLTKAQIDQLQKALPRCRIHINPKK